MKSATTNHATPRPSSLVKMESAFRFCGSVTLTMTAVMTVTSQLTFAETTTALWDGGVAQVTPTTGAFLTGCTATEKMTAETALTSL